MTVYVGLLLVLVGIVLVVAALLDLRRGREIERDLGARRPDDVPRSDEPH
jgi:hypothetical protein